MSRRVLVLGLIGLLAATPLAAAWAYHGDYEPSTQEDLQGWMFAAPNTGSQNKVYFNGFISQDAGTTTVNPNVGDPNVRSEVAGVWFLFNAVLGVWSDCNKDGYIGLGESGIADYRNEVLQANPPAGGIPNECKPQPSRPTSAAGLAAWHNDGNWVREYIPIGWSPADGFDGDAFDADGRQIQNNVVVDDDIYNIDDNSSRVWVDYQLGGFDGGHGGCLVNPQSGSLQSTGGFLEWADCGTGHTIIGAINMVSAASGHPELGFSDKPGDEWHSTGTLNVWNPFGQRDDPAFVDAWDCSAEQTDTGVAGIMVSQPNGGASPQAPSAPYAPGSSSAAGQVNSTGSGFDQCDRSTDGNRDNTIGGQASVDDASDPYSQVEVGYSSAPVKTSSTDVLNPTPTNRASDGGRAKVYDPTAAPDSAPLVDQEMPQPLGRSTGDTTENVGNPSETVADADDGDDPDDTSDDLGLDAPHAHDNVAEIDVPFNRGRVDPSGFQGIWSGQFTHIVEGPGEDSNNFKTMGIVNVTYYAYATPQPYLALPSASLGTYGGNDEVTGLPPQCGSFIVQTIAGPPTLGNAHNDWDCNTGEWYHDGDGVYTGFRSGTLGCGQYASDPDRDNIRKCLTQDYAPVVGDGYDLKDFDCWDMSVQPAAQKGVSSGVLGWWGQAGSTAACSRAP